MNKTKIGSVIACVVVVLICFIFYTRYVSETMYKLHAGYPKVESCSAKKVDEVPEGYSFRHYEDNNGLLKMEVVEVTWLLSNITNERIDTNYFRASYDSTDGSYLREAEKEEEDLAIPDYTNRKIIPPGEQVAYTDYVLVTAGCHEIEASSRNVVTQTGDGEETFIVTF